MAPKGDQAGTEVELASGRIVDTSKPFGKWLQALDAEAQSTATFSDASEITEDVITRMIQAETLEQAIEFQDSGLSSGQDIVDMEHTVHGFEVVRSTKEAGIGYYLRVYAVADEESNGYKIGEEFTYAVGAANPVFLLWDARRLDRLPLKVVYREKATTDDKKLLLMRLVPKRAS